MVGVVDGAVLPVPAVLVAPVYVPLGLPVVVSGLDDDDVLADWVVLVVELELPVVVVLLGVVVVVVLLGVVVVVEVVELELPVPVPVVPEPVLVSPGPAPVLPPLWCPECPG